MLHATVVKLSKLS